MVQTETISGALETAALAYLARAPYDHVFLTYLILFDASLSTRSAIRVATDNDGNVTGVGYFGRLPN